MDQFTNPYRPGAGTRRPPALLGRDGLIQSFGVTVRRAQLGVRVESVAPRSSGLIAKGMIYPAYGDTAFTIPLFDAFLRRALP